MVSSRALVRAIAYDIKDGEPHYLLIKAKKGYWQNAQGGIDAGESEIEALIRETQEESGLEIIAIHKNTRVYNEYDTERKGNPLHTMLSSYAVRVDSSRDVALSPKDGHTDHLWVTYDQALSLLTRYPEQIRVFEQVVKKLASR
jgi:8-oxo-dGTP pyrophosphatase MutT (NUDIX family)